MKKTIYLLLAVLFSSFAFSQGIKEKKEKIKALKVAFITEKLSLTSDEAQKFWPIYNAFDEKQFEIRHHKLRKVMDKIEGKGIENIDEKEAQALLNEVESSEDQLHQLKKKFVIDLQKVLPAKKIILLKKAEEEFNRKLLREMRERRPR